MASAVGLGERMKYRRYLLTLVVVLSLCGLLAYLAHPLLLVPLGEFLVVSDEVSPAEVIILTYGATHSRAIHAASLYHAGYAPTVVISGFDLDLAGLTPEEAQTLVRRELEGLGVPSSALVEIKPVSSSTYEEALAVKQLVEGEGWQSVIVVMEPPRARRAILTYRKVLGNRVRLISSPPPNSSFHPKHWWQTRGGLNAVYNEYPRLLYYFLAGRF